MKSSWTHYNLTQTKSFQPYSDSSMPKFWIFGIFGIVKNFSEITDIISFIIDIRITDGDLHLGLFACERDFHIHENFDLGIWDFFQNNVFESTFPSNVSKTLFWESFRGNLCHRQKVPNEGPDPVGSNLRQGSKWTLLMSETERYKAVRPTGFVQCGPSTLL